MSGLFFDITLLMEELARETTIVPSNWIILVAVIVALAIGIISFLHTVSIQRRQYRHQLLQEITDWAVNVRLYDSLSLRFSCPAF